MENTLDLNLLQLFHGSVSNNFEEIKESEKKISALYNDPERENYIKLLWKYIFYPYDEKNEQKNIFDKYLNKNVKVSMLISIKNYIKKNIHSNLEDVKLSTDLCIFMKHICMHALLDSNNEETGSLEKYYFEILFHLFKYNICDDYDFLLFYILLLYVSDCSVKKIYEVFNNPEKKNNTFTSNTVECILLYIRNREIVRNISQDNYNIDFNRILENLERIKLILFNRNGSLNDDIMSYVGNTKKVYKPNDRYDLFCFSDFALYNLDCENSSIEGNSTSNNKFNYSNASIYNNSSSNNNNNNTSSISVFGNNTNNYYFEDKSAMFSNTCTRPGIMCHPLLSMEDFDFAGKGKLLDDFNDNLRIVSTLKHSGYFKNANISFFKKKYLALKVLKKILQNYNDSSYTSKYDLKIILTHIEFPLTLYFVYLYNKFKEYNNFLIHKLNSSSVSTLEDFNVSREMGICFVLMNDLIINMCVILKIFYRINVIDLPEYYEDNMDIYFNIFYNILLYDVVILKNYFTLIDVSKTIKNRLGTTTNSGTSFIVNASGMSYETDTVTTNVTNPNDIEINNKLSFASLQKLKRLFEKNLAKCKTLVTDIVKVYAEKYQDESKLYILKLICSLTQLLYRESDKNLLCHDYNCIGATIKLIHHMSLENNELNPYKNKEFVHELLETVLTHIKLRQSDIDEILDADLDYFRNDLNNSNSYSLRTTATFFLKTLTANCANISMPLLQSRILSPNALTITNSDNMRHSLGKEKNNNSSNNIINDSEILSGNSFFDACNMEYKVQLINCLDDKQLAQGFFHSNLKELMKMFLNSIKAKYTNIEHYCHNINTYCFETASNSNMARNNLSGNSCNNISNNNTSINEVMNSGEKMIWLQGDDGIFSAQNNIYLLSILKFLINYKEVCTYDNIADIFDFLNYMLYNEKVMIHNYACLCINRILNQKKDMTIINIIATKSLNSILSRLLFLLKFEVCNKILNEYILITILRLFLIFPSQTSHYHMPVLLILNAVMNAIINDTYNPLFNHYLFELLTVLVSLIYKSQVAEHIRQTESTIIETFAQILQLFVHDFIPYIFQILSIIIDNTIMIQDLHVSILTNLYQIDLWKSSVGNANGIMCVLKSFFKKYNMFQDIIKNNMHELFNIYYYCLSNKKLTMDSFQIILTIFTYLPLDAYAAFVKPLLVLLFNYLQQYKNDIVKIKVMHAMSVLILKTGADIFVTTVEQIQIGLIKTILKSLYMPILDKLINVNEKIVIFLALARILNHESIKNDPFVLETLDCINKNITVSELVMKKNKERDDIEKDEMDKNFEITYVKLQMINNENINEMILSGINPNEELRVNLLNQHFLPVIKQRGWNNILHFMG